MQKKSLEFGIFRLDTTDIDITMKTEPRPLRLRLKSTCLERQKDVAKLENRCTLQAHDGSEGCLKLSRFILPLEHNWYTDR
jgi:hypothetical protein